MMSTPLTLPSVMRHAERVFAATEIVSVTADQGRHCYTLREAFARVRRWANVLKKFGLQPGERIATLAWNDHRHFEAYYAISCSGYVCHTINPRLFPEQIDYIINHAEDRVLLVDPAFVPLIETLAPALKSVRHFVVLGPTVPVDAKLPWLSYEAALADAAAEFEFPALDENTACALSYTSGTTGHPKGVLYSHRSTVLHCYAVALPGAFNLSPRETVLTVVPMFHVNAWSIPYAAPMTGTRLVLPGAKMGDAATLAELIASEHVTVAAGVPTVWMLLLQHLRSTQATLPILERIIVGGAACPAALLEGYEAEFDVAIHPAWGMTEMSPLGTVNNAPRAAPLAQKLKQGQPIFGVDMKIVDADNRELPWDGTSAGYLKVRGPWISSSYFNADGSDAHDADGWFDTGDIATLDADGYMQITDRAKDIIKSGGEWISSIDLENAALSHPAVQEAAVIGVPHPKWDERPLLYVVAKPGADIDTESVRTCLAQRVARWWLPDDIVVIAALPHTATGKLDKKVLRARYLAARQ
jgi:fatty-acyl-CoA synthase